MLQTARVLIVLLLGAMLWWLLWPGPAAGDAGRVASLPDEDAPRANASAEASLAAGEGERRVRGLHEPSAPQVPPDAIHGIVVDGAGVAVSGALLELVRDRDAGLMEIDLPQREERFAVLARTHSDRDGGFVFAGVGDGERKLRVSANGYARAHREGYRAGLYTRIVLQREAVLRGRVVRAADGTPLAGARLRLHPTGDLFRLRTAQSAQDGSFVFRGLEAGDRRLHAHSPEAAPAEAALQLVAGEVVEHRFELGSGLEVTGIVCERATELPVPFAEVALQGSMLPVTRADELGRYRLRCIPAPGADVLQARAPGFATGYCYLGHVPAAEGGELVADFALLRGSGAHGRVLDSRGRPLPGARVWAAGAAWQVPRHVHSSWSTTETDAGGRYRLEDLGSELDYTLFVQAPGCAPLARAFPQRVVAEQELALPDVRMQPAASVHGRVLDAEGRGVADARIRFRAVDSRWNEWGSQPAYGSLMLFLEHRTHRAREDGRFVLDALPAGELEIASGGVPGAYVTARVVLTPGQQIRDLLLKLPATRDVSGRVENPVGNLPAGLWLHCEPALPHCTLSEGLFTLRGVVPGQRYVMRLYAPGSTTELAEPQHLQLRDGEPVPEIVIRIARLREVRGQLQLDGDPAGLRVIATSVQEPSRCSVARADTDGRFHLQVRGDGDFVISVKPPRPDLAPSTEEVREYEVLAPPGGRIRPPVKDLELTVRTK